MSGYTRQSAANIAVGLPIHAADLNAEFNQLQSAFDNFAGHDHSGNGTGFGKTLVITGATANVTPSNPAGTTSTATQVMMGLGSLAILTPVKSGLIGIAASGTIQNSTAGDGATAQIFYGTGTAPVNGATVTGTSLGNKAVLTNTPSTTFTCPFSITGIIKPAAVLNTQIWIDIALQALTGGTASITNITIALWEI